MVGGSKITYLLSSFTERLYERVVPANPPKNWSYWFHACSISMCRDLALVGESKIAQVFTWKKVGWSLPHPRATLLLKRVTLHLCPPLPTPPPLAGQLWDLSCKRIGVIKKCIKSYLTQGGSVWRVILLPGTRFLHLNSPNIEIAVLWTVFRSLTHVIFLLN